MLKFWPPTPTSSANAHLPPSAPADQATPRAGPVCDPFDQVHQQSSQPQPQTGLTTTTTTTTASKQATILGVHTGPAAAGMNNSNNDHHHQQVRASPKPGPLASFPSDPRTPTMAEFGGAPMTPPAAVGMSRPTTGVTIGDSLSGTSGMGFGLREPPKMRRAMTGGTDGQGAGTTAASLSSSETGKEVSHQQHNPERAPRGTLKIKILAGRGLAIPPITSSDPGAKPEPYVVVQFEQNEFVSRPPLTAANARAAAAASASASAITPGSSAGSAAAAAAAAASAGGGKPNLPRTNSYGPSLGISSISRAFADAARRTKSSASGKKGPAAGSSGSGASTPKHHDAVADISSPLSALGLGSASPSDPVWKDEVSFDVTSSDSVIYVSVYDRSKAGEGFLGVKEIKPVLRDGCTIDNWFTLSPRGDEKVTGEIWLQISYDAVKVRQALTPKDFEIMKLIGKGTFGKVFQVRKRDTKRIYAMKMLSKKDIVAKKEIAHTIGERKILQRSLECPFLVGLKFSFQTEEYLFFITDYKSGGELFWHLQKEGRFTENRARFYVAELVLALEHLHKYNIVYRDLKPENILLDATGHVALCDFGLSKPDLGAGQLTNTFCGTTEYLAPEVLLDDHGYSKLVDFWSLGVLLFEMCCGWSPFYSEDVQQMYKNICFGKIRFPRGVIGEDGKQFVKGLLNRNPKHRLGAERDAAELKEHPFFKSIDWDLLAHKQITPPFKPVVESDESVANFDPLFTSSDLRDIPFEWGQNAAESSTSGSAHSYNGPSGSDRNGKSPVAGAGSMAIKPTRPPIAPIGGSPLTSSIQENFRGFTYTGESMLPMSTLAHAQGDGYEDADSDEEAIQEEDEYDYSQTDQTDNDDGSRTRRQSDVDMEG
ncbi:hypothetical protein QFC21_005890 [Naganishia friedmannii]|uniref:Uncharacterized protein n=1 Tax=Naganishia friedmannii TaxID=89922 RepID=A0ACC2V641_9TREE|nr:hypothetical protein QFC21_005890 [Naganishia friedmannii]